MGRSAFEQEKTEGTKVMGKLMIGIFEELTLKLLPEGWMHGGWPWTHLLMSQRELALEPMWDGEPKKAFEEERAIILFLF